MKPRRDRIRRILIRAIAPLLAGLMPTMVWGAPQGGHVVAGSATISAAGSTLSIKQITQRSIINWSDFSIAGSENVRFILPSSSSAVFNRVTSGNASQIDGSLQSNGSVYLINPNGIIIGPGGKINAQSFVASTLDVNNAAFMAGGSLLFSGNSGAAVVNQGKISALGGDVILIAARVQNNGQISAPSGAATLAAGSQVLLQQVGVPGVTVRVTGNGTAGNTGAINATIAQLAANGGNTYALAINNTGVIRATGTKNINGHIYLTGGASGTVENSGKLDASSTTGSGGQIIATGQRVLIDGSSNLNANGATGGGEVLVGGSWQNNDSTVPQSVGTVVLGGAVLEASATQKGDGGTVVVRSDVDNPASVTRAYGTFLANGGPDGGNGGRIETSGYWLDTAGSTISASAPMGQAGQWLLDPYNLTISSSSTSSFNETGNPWVPTASGGNVTASDINSALNLGNNVTISTGSSGGDLGNIIVNAAITKSSGASTATFTLDAANNISINQPITCTSGGLNIVLDAQYGSAGAIILASNLSTNGGNINFGTGRTSGGTLIGGDVYLDGSSAQTLSTSGGNVTIAGQMIIANPSGLTITTSGGTVSFESTVDSGDSYTFVNSSMSWVSAEVAAKGSTGGAGAIGDTYLATITSSLENTIASAAAGYQAAWLGGNRVVGIGTNQIWRWVTGPEGLEDGGLGLEFFTSNFTGGGGTAINGAYTHWNGGEPNNSGGANTNTASESALQFLGTTGLWNDLSQTSQNEPYLVETNLAFSPLTVNAGAGSVTFSGLVGGNKALASLTVTGPVAMNGGGVITTGAQTYNNAMTLGSAATTLQVNSADLNLSQSITYSGSTTAALTLQVSGSVNLTSTAITASGTGALNVTLDTHNDAGTDSGNSGAIVLTGGSTITTNGGNIIMGGGVSPSSTAAYGTSTDPLGINLDNATLTTGNGSITLTGVGGTTTTGQNYGVVIQDGTQLTTNAGTMTIHGTGGGTSTGGSNSGIAILNSNLAVDGNGGISLTGTGGATSGTGNYGVYMNTSALGQLTGTGSITVVGQGGGSTGSYSNDGVLLQTSSINSGVATIGVTGTGGVGTASNGSEGVNFQGTTPGILSSGSATISITATAGTGSPSVGVMAGVSTTIGGALDTGNITVSSDTLSIDNTGAPVSFQSSAQLLLQPLSAGTNIAVGSGVSATFDLSTTALGNIQTGFSQIIVGRVNGTGAVSVGTAAFNAPVTIRTPMATANDITVTGALSTGSGAAAGSIMLQSGRSVIVDGGSISTDDEGVTLDADASAIHLGNIQLIDGASITTSGGSITLGGGTNAAATAAYGISGSASGIDLDDATLNSGDGAITLTGVGGANSTNANEGVIIQDGSQITANNGTITILGTGGGTSGSTSNDGVFIRDSGTEILSTGTGQIILNGTGGGATGTGNFGTCINYSGLVKSSGTGAINITGMGGGSSGSYYNDGVAIHRSTVTSAAGAITITGTGGPGTSVNESDGVTFEGSTAAVQSTGNAPISITGTAGTGTPSVGVWAAVSTNIGGSLDTANITLTADTLSIDNSGAPVSFQSSAQLLLQPLSVGTNIAVGSGVSATFDLSTTAIGNIHDGFSQVIVGRANGTGAVSVGTAAFSDPVTIRTPLATANDITVSGALSTGSGAAAGSILLQSGRSVIVDGGSISTDDAAVTLDADADAIHQGNIQLIDGSITTNGGAITLGGGTNAATTAAWGLNSGTVASSSGVFINQTSLDSSGGNISLRGRGSTSGTPDDAVGVMLEYLSSLDSGTGTIVIGGIAPTGGTTGNMGVNIRYQNSQGSGGTAGVTGSTITSANTSSSAIIIDGIGSTTTATNSAGVTLQDGSSVTATGTGGSITISGTGGAFADNTNPGNHGINLDAGTNISASGGNVTLNASSPSGVAAINNYNSGTRTISANSTSGIVTLNPSNDGATLDSTVISGDQLLLTGSGAFTLTDTSNLIGTLAGSISGGNLQFVNDGSLTIGSVSGTNGLSDTGGTITVVAQGTTADLTLDKNVSGVGSGSSVVLAAGQNFLNTASATISTGAGRFLVYSTTPVDSNVGGLSGGEIYNVTYAGNPPSGITASGNQFLYSVDPTLTFTADDKTKQYSQANPTLTYTVTGFLGSDTISQAISGSPLLSTSATSASSVGNYAIDITSNTIVSSIGYSLNFVAGNLSVTKAPLTITAVDKTKLYGAALPTLTASYSGLVNGDGSSAISGLSLSTSAMASSNVGAYGITASGATSGNYSITLVPGTLTINKVPLTITADDQSKLYGAALPTFTASYSGLVNGDEASAISGLSLSTSATASSNVGAYYITGSGATSGNYNITLIPGTLTINQAPLTIMAVDKNKLYGAAMPTLTASYSGLVNGDSSSAISGLSLSTSATASSNVGAYDITPSGASSGNYNITLVPGTLTINKSPLTITADDQSKLYGAALPTFTASYSGLVNGDSSSAISGLSLSTSATASSNAGAYCITASGATSGNYNIVLVPGTLTINKAPLAITADDQSKLYGAAMPTLTASYSGLVNGDDSSAISGLSLSTLATASSNVGVYDITASGATSGNYNITLAPGALTINKVPLTITAEDQSKFYGAPLPTLTASYSGLVNGDGAGAITGLSLSTAASASSIVGAYDITASGATSGNYNITLLPGTLTIDKAPLTIAANDKIRDADASNPLLTETFFGLVNGDLPADVPGTTLTTSANINSPVGQYAIIISGGTNSNYDITLDNGMLFVLNGFTQGLRTTWQSDAALSPNFATDAVTQPPAMVLANTQIVTTLSDNDARHLNSYIGPHITYRDSIATLNVKETGASARSRQVLHNAIAHFSSFDLVPASGSNPVGNHVGS